MASKPNVVSIVRSLAEPVAEELGLRLWDVRFVKEGASWFLRIFIDKDGGVDINNCVDMTHAINPVLDEKDPIEQSYCLEVCSPGLERDLTRDEHFEVMIGKKIKLRLIRPDENKQREFAGILKGYEEGNITVDIDGEERVFIKKETSWVKLDDFGD
ncbi:MAG: ribosome maturation factor RimP [Clostridia bacterium]|nr:ribosome maturation factor RimP [Clostridia bacterium]